MSEPVSLATETSSLLETKEAVIDHAAEKGSASKPVQVEEEKFQMDSVTVIGEAGKEAYIARDL